MKTRHPARPRLLPVAVAIACACALPEASRAALFDKAFTGDLDQMIKRRVIRAGVAYNRTRYFVAYTRVVEQLEARGQLDKAVK